MKAEAETEAEAQTGTQFILFDLIKKTMQKMIDEFFNAGGGGGSQIPHAR